MNTPNRPLDAALARLPAELPPARDLWPAIAAQLGDARATASPATATRTRQRPLALAAGLAMCALAGALAWNARLPRPAAGPSTLAANRPAGGTDAGTAGGSAQPAAAHYGQPDDSAYQAARATLEATFEQRLALLAPATQERVRQDLATIRAANADLRAALAKDPASPLLLQLLASTWRQEIDLYSSVARTTSPLIQRRTRT